MALKLCLQVWITVEYNSSGVLSLLWLLFEIFDRIAALDSGEMSAAAAAIISNNNRGRFNRRMWKQLTPVRAEK